MIIIFITLIFVWAVLTEIIYRIAHKIRKPIVFYTSGTSYEPSMNKDYWKTITFDDGPLERLSK